MDGSPLSWVRAWMKDYPFSLFYIVFCVTVILVLQVITVIKG